MFGLTEWKQTRFYQEVEAEGRQKREEEMLSTAIPQLLERGFSVEEIAQIQGVDVETVRKFSDPRSR